MTQQLVEMLADPPPCVEKDCEVQELIKLLVEAVLTLPDSEKKRVLDKSIAPLFEALLTLEKVPGIGLIWMTLIVSGYRDYAGQLLPQKGRNREEPCAIERGSSSAAAAAEETPDVV